MTPIRRTSWQLFSKNDKLINPAINSWINEDESLIKRLSKKYGEISLQLISEKICIHKDEEISDQELEGNLRKIFLSSDKEVVYAESFFSNSVINKFNKFGALGNQALGKYLFSLKEIEKLETYVAEYVFENLIYTGRKCVYSLSNSKFSVIEVFLFNE
tara:strand:+ start:34 stop:510 length:477 start_codon:yes stop_codon:yes gene_type:complete